MVDPGLRRVRLTLGYALAAPLGLETGSLLCLCSLRRGGVAALRDSGLEDKDEGPPRRVNCRMKDESIGLSSRCFHQVFCTRFPPLVFIVPLLRGCPEFADLARVGQGQEVEG